MIQLRIMSLEYIDKRDRLIFAISDETMPKDNVNHGITRGEWDSLTGFTYGALRRRVRLEDLWNGMLDEIEEKLKGPRPDAIRGIIPNIAAMVVQVYNINTHRKNEQVTIDTLHRIRRHSPAVQFLERTSM